MKRFTHAWIALRAIDRLDKLAERILQNAEKSQNEANLKANQETDPKKRQKKLKEIEQTFREETDKYDSIKNLQALLRNTEKIPLVVQGTWIPDNVIADNQDGHIWKYEPPLEPGQSTKYEIDGKEYQGYQVKVGRNKLWYRTDHAKTSSLCFEEAQNTYAWNQPWRKVNGYLAYRCEAVRQAIRDMFLFQEDEMKKLAATVIIRFGDDFLSKQAEVTEFLSDPKKVKDYYDGDGNIHRKAIVNLRNLIGKDETVSSRIRDCMQLYRDDIKNQITKSNGLNFSAKQSSFFPMFFTDDQIILSLFTISHYLSDAHMPLHADSRDFSDEKCGDIHGAVEEVWEDWILSPGNATNLKDILSESERARKFMKTCFEEQEPTWKNYQYPDQSLLQKFDQELGKTFWEDREIEPYDTTNLWDETVGITYASYCLASRLLPFTDSTRVIPKGTGVKYGKNFANPKEITKDNWLQTKDTKQYPCPPDKAKLRKQIYDFAKAQGGDNIDFNYLSLLILVDAVECVAKVWGKIIEDHLDITCQTK